MKTTRTIPRTRGQRTHRGRRPPAHRTIGVLTYGMQHSICYDLWKGMHAVAQEHGSRLIWFPGDQIRCPFGGFREQANIVYELADRENVDGLVIWGGSLAPHLTAEETQAFYDRYNPLPIVSLSYPLPGIPSVIADNYQGMRDVLIHLIEAHGYRRIAFMRGPVNGIEAEDRYRAYRDVLQSYHLPVDKNLVLYGNNEALPAAAAIRELLDSRQLHPPRDFEAVAAANDVMALAIIEVFREREIRVPQDVALIGFDDVGQARAVTPPLTTVRYDFETLGREAAMLLLKMMRGETTPEQVVTPLAVCVRESCGCVDASVRQAAITTDLTDLARFHAPRGNVTARRSASFAAERQVSHSDAERRNENVMDTTTNTSSVPEGRDMCRRLCCTHLAPTELNPIYSKTKSDVDLGSLQACLKTSEVLYDYPTTDLVLLYVNPLFEAFQQELQGVEPGMFLNALQKALQQAAAADQDIEVWQDVISTLRQEVEKELEETARHSADFAPDYERRLQAESLCQQARVMIGKTARRVQEFKRLYAVQQEQTLREIGVRLLTTFETQSLMDILAEELPRLDIPAGYIALYDDPQPYAYPQPAPQWARLQLAYQTQGRVPVESDHGRFATRELIPTQCFPQHNHADLVVMPLFFRDEQLGIALFEATPREGTVYHALRTEISSALQGALLVQRVQEHAAEIARQKYVLDTFMATVPDSIYFKDREGRIIQVNQAYANAFGFADPAAEIGLTDFDFFPQELAQGKYDQEQQIIRTGQPLMALEEAGNEGRWSLTTKMPLRNEHGEIIGTFGISRDITRLKEAERELLLYQNHLEDLVRERTAELRHINARLNDEIVEHTRAEEARRAGEQQYRMLAEYVKDGILIAQGGQLVFVNTAFAEMVGHPIEHILQQNPLNLFADHARQQVSAYLTRTAADTAQTGWQVELKAGDGRTLWTEIEETPIVWNSQFALLLTVRNVHHTKLRELRLEEERARLRQENLTFRSALTERYRFGPLVGKSPAMQRIYELIVNAATSGVNVLVVGESGTGKELIARTIHQVSRRKDHPFVPVNCASIPETLFEREFFGHRKGAFTGADRDTPGFFDRAHQGVLFLDEVAELTPGMQAKLLRVLQDGEYTPLGSNRAKRADVVIVAATNKDCRDEIEAKRLRQDFFYRIAVIEVSVPPLRERREDLPLLIDHLLDQYQQKQAERKNRNQPELPTDQTMLPAELVQALYAYAWPGNVRELQNVLQRYLATHDGQVILNVLGTTPRAIPLPEATRFAEPFPLNEAVQAFEKQVLADIWARNGYHTNRTAEQLGIPRRTLSHKLAQYQIKKPGQ